MTRARLTGAASAGGGAAFLFAVALLAVAPVPNVQACGFPPGVLPPGSYAFSCFDCVVEGPILTCSCAGRFGTRSTSINITECQTEPANTDGELVCSRCTARGACCREDSSCVVQTSAACEGAGEYQGDGTTCAAACAVTWINAAGGAFGEPANWDPARVPNSSDTAIFPLAPDYAVNVAGAEAGRFVIRNGSLDLVGGSAEVNSTALDAPSLSVGSGAVARLLSGTLSSIHALIGDGGSPAELKLLAAAPTWTNTGRLTVGGSSDGTLTIETGHVTSGESHVGSGAGEGRVVVKGPGRWTTGNIGFGFDTAAGFLDVVDGGVVESEDALLGVLAPGSEVTLHATAADVESAWLLSGTVSIGGPAATVRVESGGRIEANSLTVLGSADTAGELVIERTSDTATAPRVVVQDEVTFDSDGLIVVRAGRLSTQKLEVGQNAETIVQLSGGGTLTATGAVTVFSNGTITALAQENEAPSTLIASDHAEIDGTLRFGPRAELYLDGGATIGVDGVGSVEVRAAAGRPATLSSDAGLIVGAGQLEIADGAVATIGTLDIGLGSGPLENGFNLVTVFGDARGRLDVAGKITAGVLGPGRLNVSGGDATADTLQVGGIASAPGEVFLQRDAALRVAGNARIGDEASGLIQVEEQIGLTPASLVVGGTIDVTPRGILRLVGGDVRASGVVVAGGGRVEGHGVLHGAVTVQPAGFLEAGLAADAAAPNARALLANAVAAGPGLTIDGDLAMAPDSTLRVQIGGIDVGGLHVTGKATLAGTLEIVFVNGFVPRAGDHLRVLDALGGTTGAFAAIAVTGLPPGWKGALAQQDGILDVTVLGDYLCYRTAATGGGAFPKNPPGHLDTLGGPFDFVAKKPVVLCQPSGPATGSQQDTATRLRGYAMTGTAADPLVTARRVLRVTNALHPGGELLVDTGAVDHVLTLASACLDDPAGVCPVDPLPPSAGPSDAFLCTAAKYAKASAKLGKGRILSAVDGFGEPRTYRLAKPSRVCAPASGDLLSALACYIAKPVAKACAPDAPANAAGLCKRESDCGGTKNVTAFCGRSSKHARRGPFVFATSIARDRARTVKPIELCVPSGLTSP